ncbi:MAG: DNA mismatch repair protein MutS [Polyangiaceae bacterium]
MRLPSCRPARAATRRSDSRQGQAVRVRCSPRSTKRARLLRQRGLLHQQAPARRAERLASVRFNSVFGWYIEVTRSQLAKVPTAWRRKQTVATGERFTTPALDQLAADLETATDRARERELSILDSLLEETRTHAGKIRDLAATLSAIDVASALAELAHQSDYVRPTIDTSDRIDLEECRHPVVEQLAARGKFVPNDASLDVAGERLWLVTGPNMAGKSTFMRQVALAVVLAQAGSYVPARRARIGVVDRILSRVGASDNVARGESTFMVEMRETAAILRSATRRSLVILDEIGRGTSTYDGLAIAWAVAEHLHDVVRCRALFATHYHELTELASTAKHLANVSVSAREHDGGIVFLHTVSHGPASRSYGIAVAKLAGLPESVVARARALLTSFESDGAPNSSRGSTGPRNKRSASDDASQLALFAPPSSSPAEKAALETLRQLDVDRTTPLDALALLTKLKAALRPSS